MATDNELSSSNKNEAIEQPIAPAPTTATSNDFEVAALVEKREEDTKCVNMPVTQYVVKMLARWVFCVTMRIGPRTYWEWNFQWIILIPIQE